MVGQPDAQVALPDLALLGRGRARCLNYLEPASEQMVDRARGRRPQAVASLELGEDGAVLRADVQVTAEDERRVRRPLDRPLRRGGDLRLSEVVRAAGVEVRDAGSVRQAGERHQAPFGEAAKRERAALDDLATASE